MAQTKIKKDLIDASFGNILEQIVYFADGRTITTSAGNITVPNVTTSQTFNNATFAEANGSSIAYTPPTGSTLVNYEYLGQAAYPGSGTQQSPIWKVQLDGTDILATRKSLLQQTTYEQQIIANAAIRITGGSDDIANMAVGSWTSNKTIRVMMCAYSSSYGFKLNFSYHGSVSNTGTNWDVINPPVIKITAYS